MKKIFFKIGTGLQLILIIGHLFVLRKGLPIPVIDAESKMLVELMKNYHFFIFDTSHTLDQTLTGYDYSWAALVLFIFIASIITLSTPINLSKAKKITLFLMVLWLANVIIAYINWGIPQLALFILLFITFLLSYIYDWRKPKLKDTRICIVGAGLSGLTAAYQLQKQGYQHVTLFEKEHRVGGKCYTNVQDWHPYDLGGHEMLAGYSDLIQFAGELGVPTRTSVAPLVYNPQEGKYLNFKKAATESGKYSLFQVMIASIRYLYIVGIQFRKFSNPASGFKNMPKELEDELITWLKSRKLMPLADTFSFVIKAQGYGGDNDTKAAYLVKFMGAKNWFSLLLSGMGLSKKWPKVFVHGAQNFCESMAASIQDVRLNTRISKIERIANQSIGGVRVFIKGESEPIEYDKLIISTPFAINGLSFLDLESEEKEYFARLHTQPVMISMCQIQGLPTGVVATLPLNNLEKGEYTGYIKDFADAPYAFFLSLLKPDMTKEYILDEIEKVLKTVAPYYGVQPKLIKSIEQKKWDYFPSVRKEYSIQETYNGLESMQGKYLTYYASSALSFECMGNCVAYSKRLIHNNF